VRILWPRDWLPKRQMPKLLAERDERWLDAIKTRRSPLWLYAGEQIAGPAYKTWLLDWLPECGRLYLDPPSPQLPIGLMQFPSRWNGWLLAPESRDCRYLQLPLQLDNWQEDSRGRVLSATVMGCYERQDRRQAPRISLPSQSVSLQCWFESLCLHASLHDISTGGLCFSPEGDAQPVGQYLRECRRHQQPLKVVLRLRSGSSWVFGVRIVALEPHQDRPYPYRVHARFVQLGERERTFLGALQQQINR
jgi:hypothetical protein